MSRFSDRVHLVDWDSVSLEKLKLLKMEKGMSKHGDPEEVGTNEYVADLMRKGAEFIIVTGSGDTREMMEIIADISNVCDILFPKIQRDYVEEMKGPLPDCFGTEQYNSLQCRKDPCTWRSQCITILEAETGKFLREMDNIEQDRFSTRFE